MRAGADEIFPALDSQLWTRHTEFVFEDVRFDLSLFSDVREDETFFLLQRFAIFSESVRVSAIRPAQMRNRPTDENAATIESMVAGHDPLVMPIGRRKSFDGEELVIRRHAPIVRRLWEATVAGMMDEEVIVRSYFVEGFSKVPEDKGGDFDGVGGLLQKDVVDEDALDIGAEELADARNEVEMTAGHIMLKEEFDDVRSHQFDRQLG